MSKLDHHYEELMKNHPYGVALYHPLPQSQFRGGWCGYFDRFGAWNPITRLDDMASLTKLGLTPVEEELQKAPVDDRIKWGPKVSEHMHVQKTGLTIGLDSTLTAGLPVAVGGKYMFSTDKAEGAVLLTVPPVVHERYYYESPFKKWMKTNAAAILKRRPEVKEYGLWIITSTYATKACAINMWKEGGYRVEIGFLAKAVGIGELGPSGEWMKDARLEGWSEYEFAKGEDMYVVFFAGLKFKFKWYSTRQITSRPGASTTRAGTSNKKSVRGETETIIANIPADIVELESGNIEQGIIKGFYNIDCENYLEEDDDQDATADSEDW